MEKVRNYNVKYWPHRFLHSDTHVLTSCTGKGKNMLLTEPYEQNWVLIICFKKVILDLFSTDNTNDNSLLGFFRYCSVWLYQNYITYDRRKNWVVEEMNLEKIWVSEFTFLIVPSSLCHFLSPFSSILLYTSHMTYFFNDFLIVKFHRSE